MTNGTTVATAPSHRFHLRELVVERQLSDAEELRITWGSTAGGARWRHGGRHGVVGRWCWMMDARGQWSILTSIGLSICDWLRCSEMHGWSLLIDKGLLTRLIDNHQRSATHVRNGCLSKMPDKTSNQVLIVLAGTKQQKELGYYHQPTIFVSSSGHYNQQKVLRPTVDKSDWERLTIVHT